MTTRHKLLAGAIAMIGIPIVGAAVILIGNNTSTQLERCDRFWMSAEASYECHQAYWQQQEEVTDRQLDEASQRVEESKEHLRETDDAIMRLSLMNNRKPKR